MEAELEQGMARLAVETDPLALTRSTADIDFVTLYALKDRFHRLMVTLLAIRNFLAKQSRDLQPWKLPPGTPLSQLECTEYVLRMMFRRCYWIYMETPF